MKTDKENVTTAAEAALSVTNSIKVKVDEKDACGILTENLKNLILCCPKKFEDIVVICIGTDRSTGDSLGPLVGTFLRRRRKIKRIARILGCLEYPVHIKNMDFFLRTVQVEKNLIIAVDAAIGKEESIGKIHMYEGCLYPGSGVGKKMRDIGDISICGIVNSSMDKMEDLNQMVLQNTRLSLVYNMAILIAEAVNKGLAGLADMEKGREKEAKLKVLK